MGTIANIRKSKCALSGASGHEALYVADFETPPPREALQQPWRSMKSHRMVIIDFQIHLVKRIVSVSKLC